MVGTDLTYLFILGGCTGGCSSAAPNVTDTVWRYVHAQDTMTPVSKLNTPRMDLAATAAQDGSNTIYTTGGRNPTDGVLKSAECLGPSGWTTLPSMNEARYGHGIAAWGGSDPGVTSAPAMYVVGGFDKNNAALDVVEQLDLVANEVCTVTNPWKTMTATMTTKRAYHGMLLGLYQTNSVCAAGGQSEVNGDGLATMECLGLWTECFPENELCWKPKASLNAPRTQFAVTHETIWSPDPDGKIVDGVVVFILGGKDSAKSKGVLATTEFMRQLASGYPSNWITGPTMREGRAFFGAGAVKDAIEHNLIAVGGETADGLPSDTMEFCVGLGCLPTSAPTTSPSTSPSRPTERPTASPSAAPSPAPAAPTASPTPLRPTGGPTPPKKFSKPDLAVIVAGSAVALGVALYCAYRRGRGRRARAGSGYERQYSDERELDPHASGFSAYGSANAADDRSPSSGDRSRKPSSGGRSRDRKPSLPRPHKGTFSSLSFASGDAPSSAAAEHIIRQLEMRVDHMEEELEKQDAIIRHKDSEIKERDQEVTTLQEAWRIAVSDLALDAFVASGSEGRVYRGRWRGTIDVAVKMIPRDPARPQAHGPSRFCRALFPQRNRMRCTAIWPGCSLSLTVLCGSVAGFSNAEVKAMQRLRGTRLPVKALMQSIVFARTK